MAKTIIQVMGMHSNKFGGLERLTVEVSRRLKDEGYKSIVIYEQLPKSQEYLNLLEECNVQVIVMPSRGKQIFSFLVLFTKLLIKERPKVVHAHFDPAGYAAILLSTIFLIKTRLRSFHGMLTVGVCISDALSQLSFKTKFLKRLQYLLATQFFAVSEGVKSEYENIFRPKRTKIEVLYLGVSPNMYNKEISRPKYNLPENRLIITCIAFHDPIKGVDVLLNALKILVNDYRQTNFLLCQIGEGKDTELLQKLANENQLCDYVQWLGLQNNVPEIMAASDIYVQPSRSEGIPLAIMEASMAELPLIGSNVGGVPEVVVDGVTGMLTEADNPRDLADKLHQLLTNEQLRIKLGSAARRHAMKHFNIESQSERMVKKYLKKTEPINIGNE